MVIDNIYDNSLSKTSNTISGPLTTPKPITVPSMPQVPNTIHAVVLSRVSNMELEN